MKILVFGRNGQVGWELQRALAPLGLVVALGRSAAGGLRSDFRDPEALAATVREVSPDVIVNAAAHTAVDLAESEPELARTVNAVAPGVLAREAQQIDALLVHYSTDYVFDGSGAAPWKESDAARPLNVYGRTKLEGEEAIRGSGCRHLILRTSWVYAARGKNFLRTILRLAASRDTLRMVNDQIGAPTAAELIADLTAHAIQRVRADARRAGTYHVAAAGETNWHEYACFIVDRAREAGWTLRMSSSNIEPVPTEAFPLPALRSRNSRLDCSAFARAFGLYFADWREGVERAIEELRPHEVGADQ